MGFIDDFLASGAPAKPAESAKYRTGWSWSKPKHVLAFDFETPYDSAHSVKSSTWDEYVEHVRSHIDEVTISWGLDGAKPRFACYGTALFREFVDQYLELGAGTETMFAAHEMIFDARIARDVLDLPWPRRALCTRELAHRAFPSQPKGYGLANLSHSLPGLPHKIEIDLQNCTHEELEAYNIRDVEGCYTLYERCVEVLGDEELMLAEIGCRACSHQIYIDPEKAQQATHDFVEVATAQVQAVLDVLGEEVSEGLFGWQGDKVRSVRYTRLRAALQSELGFSTDTTSKKLLNPAKLQANPEAAIVVDAVSEMGKAMSHSYRVRKLGGVKDVNYRYSFANTGRPSGSGSGKGSVNLLNVPKRNKAIANIVRPLYQFDRYVISADLANAEYRAMGPMVSCKHILDTFGKDPLADPYAVFCQAATGIYPEAGPLRDVFKQAVLSLLFLCGLAKWMSGMMLAVARGEVSLDDLRGIAKGQGWRMPRNSRWFDAAVAKTRAPEAIAAVCFHTYNLFHELHPEVRAFGKWLCETVEGYAAALDPEAFLRAQSQRPGAPDPKYVELTTDHDKRGERSILVRCGLWSPTVNWRGVQVRKVKDAEGLSEFKTAILHERKGFRPVHPSLLIENVTQSFSRNGMSELKLRMAYKHGFKDQFDIYDDEKVLCHAGDVQRCYEALCAEAGPGSDGCGYGNFLLIKPDEVEIGRTMKGWTPPLEWWSNPDFTQIPEGA